MAKKNKIDFEKEFENFEEESLKDIQENCEDTGSVELNLDNETGEDVNNQCDCEQCEQENNESYYLNLAQRVQAEFDNYRKRTRQAELDAKEKGRIEAVLELLPIVDSLDNAKKIALNEETQDAINIIEKQLYQCFDKLGVKKMNSLGATFDANVHNAIMVGQDESHEDDVIIQVFQEGFTMNDKVIRYAMVQVNKR